VIMIMIMIMIMISCIQQVFVSRLIKPQTH